MHRSHQTNATVGESGTGGRFVIGADRRITEWGEAMARRLGVLRSEALDTPCDQVLAGKDDFGHAVCGPACPALKALAAGSVTGTAKMLARAADGTRLRLTCELIALPGGGALGSQRCADDAAPDLAYDLAGIAALTARVADEPLQQGLRHALDFLLERTAADAGEVFLAEPHGRGVIRTCHRGGFERSFDELLRFDPDEGFPGRVLAHGQAVYTEHLAEDPHFLRAQVKRDGFKTYVCNPLTSGDDALGCIALAFRHADIDLQRVLNLLCWVSTPLGAVVDRALAHLRDAATTSLHGVEADPEHRLPRALRAVLQEMVGVSRADSGELYLPGHGTELRWRVPGTSAAPRCPVLNAETIGTCPAFQTGATRTLHGRRNSWPLTCRAAPHPGGAWCCIPMSCDGQSLGVIQLRYRHLRPSPPNENLALLEGIASLAAEKVRDVRDQLARAPHTDAPAAASDIAPRPTQSGSLAIERHHDEARLQIRCFGSLELSVDGTRVAPTTIRRKRVLTLLGILLTQHDQPLCKDVLIETLWPDADFDARTRQFHVLVHELRKLLEPHRGGGDDWQYVCSHADRYWFNTQSSCWIDTLEFRALLELGRKAEAAHEPQAAIDAYEAAAKLHRGGYIQDEPFGEWCGQTREQLREACLDALGRLSTLWGELGRWDKGMAWLRRALVLDPLREETHRALMYALWAAGRRDEAVRQYEACAHLLRERLDLPLLPETEQLFARIRATPRPHTNH